MALPTGVKAPDFTHKTRANAVMTDVSLSDNGGKHTVLLFFPLAFTSVCTREMCDMSAGLASYEALNARVLGISIDSPYALEAWAQKERITIPLLSDLNKTTAKAYDVLLDGVPGLGSVSARAAFVIDRDGVIRYSEQTPTPKDLPDFEAVKKALEHLK